MIDAESPIPYALAGAAEPIPYEVVDEDELHCQGSCYRGDEECVHCECCCGCTPCTYKLRSSTYEDEP